MVTIFSVILNVVLLCLWVYARKTSNSSKEGEKHPCNCDTCKQERNPPELPEVELRYQYVSYYRGNSDVADYDTYIRYLDKQNPGLLTMVISNQYWNEYLCQLHIKSMNDHELWLQTQKIGEEPSVEITS